MQRLALGNTLNTYKVQVWCDEIKSLLGVTETFPHAAYMLHLQMDSLVTGYNCIMCTIPDIQGLLQPLEEAIHKFFISALFGRPPCSSMERDLYALPVQLGGLGLVNPCKAAVSSFNASVQLTSPLIALIISQCADQTADPMRKHGVLTFMRAGSATPD